MKIQNVEKLSIVQARSKLEKIREKNIDKVPMIESDVQEVADMTAYVMEDSAMIAELANILLEDSSVTAEVLVILLEKITELEARTEQLEGGK